MRPTLAGDDLRERVGIRLNLAPIPVGYTFFGMPAARAVAVAQRLGVYRVLIHRPRTAEEVAVELGLSAAGTRMLLDTLAGLRLLVARGASFRVHRRARRWLDPDSPRYVGTYLEHTLEYWDWWAGLEGMLRDGSSIDLHGRPAEDPSWPIYIRGQYELARLSAAEVARAIDLPDSARSLLDVAGGHGWFAAALCQRHPELSATVLDLAPSAAVGREIIREAGLGERVRHVDGDMREADLGGPHDGALFFDILHHLDRPGALSVLRRIRDALRPGAPLVVLDMFRPEGGRPRASAGSFRLFFALTSGADIYGADELSELLGQAGFGPPRRRRVRSIPDQRLYQASAR